MGTVHPSTCHAMHPCCRGHAVLHDSYTLLHVMRCILAGAMLFFTIATPFYMSCYASLLQGPCYTSGRDPWQNVSTLLLTMNLLKNTWEIHRKSKSFDHPDLALLRLETFLSWSLFTFWCHLSAMPLKSMWHWRVHQWQKWMGLWVDNVLLGQGC